MGNGVDHGLAHRSRRQVPAFAPADGPDLGPVKRVLLDEAIDSSIARTGAERISARSTIRLLSVPRKRPA